MDEYLRVILLAALQGFTEFLPISSSGHLVLAEHLLAWGGQSVSVAAGKDLEVMLHLGTLLSIFVFYRHDLRRMLFEPRTLAMLIVATVPAAAIGLSLNDWFDQVFDSPAVVGFGLIMTAVLLWLGQALEQDRYRDGDLPWICGIVIGCFQAAALIPGISRSGSTIAGGLLMGVDRLAATKFSFLLSIPVTSGAILLTSLKIWKTGETTTGAGPLIAGVIVSFVVGLLTLKWLLKLVSQRKLHWFAIYCIAIGSITLAACLLPPELLGASVASPGE